MLLVGGANTANVRDKALLDILAVLPKVVLLEIAPRKDLRRTVVPGRALLVVAQINSKLLQCRATDIVGFVVF